MREPKRPEPKKKKGPGRIEKEFLVSILRVGWTDRWASDVVYPQSPDPHPPFGIGSQNCSERRLERPPFSLASSTTFAKWNFLLPVSRFQLPSQRSKLPSTFSRLISLQLNLKNKLINLACNKNFFCGNFDSVHKKKKKKEKTKKSFHEVTPDKFGLGDCSRFFWFCHFEFDLRNELLRLCLLCRKRLDDEFSG
ncbi:hypothetical protein CEXT_599191 [Caerostris extrusa]|uniref:Uncharacterized protein n=1 Tax=Caerostris extrusa TaxID=172846 RepID=A0AAV4SAM3_CAEEX|nr:hypothetical protein CEXT_599191 [Caerostris extrusa]